MSLRNKNHKEQKTVPVCLQKMRLGQYNDRLVCNKTTFMTVRSVKYLWDTFTTPLLGL